MVGELHSRKPAEHERLLTIQVEECQIFIQRQQEQTAEQKELDAVQVRLTRLREEMLRASSQGPRSVPTASSSRDEAEREEFCKKRARSLSIISPDMPGASEQSVWLCFSVRQGTDLL